MRQYKFVLEGLSCANCAAKIETAVANSKGITGASLNFATKTLSFQKTGDDMLEVKNWTQKLVDAIEDGVTVTEPGGREIPKQKKYSSILKIGFSLVLFGLALCLQFLLPVPLWAAAVFYGSAAVLSSYRVFFKGVKSGLRLKPDENTLLTVAVIAAFCIGEYMEAALVALLFSIGEALEDKAVASSRKDIEKLAEIRPDTANLQRDGEVRRVAAQEVKIGETVLVYPHERVALDGVVLSGGSTLDASAITGESMPLQAQGGTKVMSGMINGAGLLTVKVENSYEDSAASRILKMVEDAAAAKGHSEKIITRFARIYTPAVMAFAVLLAVLPPVLGFDAFTVWLSRALVFLVAACPCALVISVPLGFYSGIGAASKIGVLVKGGKYIEALAKADTFVFDKTGTLTTGNLRVIEAEPGAGFDRDGMLALAAAAEKYSSHPAALAVKAAAKGLTLPELTNYKEEPGMGVSAVYQGKKVTVGGARVLDDVQKAESGVIYLIIDGKPKGKITVGDALRGETPDVIAALKSAGAKQTAMLTGDCEKTAAEAAARSGVSYYRSELLPQDKVTVMEELSRQSKASVFVGDGINDSPVLAAADCGIAMGLGSQAAIEAADAVLTSGNLKQLPQAVLLCRKVMNTVRFNIVFALLVKAVILVLAATGYAPMWLAVLADTGVSVLSVLNAARLLRVKKKTGNPV